MSEIRKKTVQLYTDGACSGNPGPGGWGCILNYNGKTKEMSGHMPNTTNNRMEIFAVISGIGALKEPCVIDVYSDSAYTVNAFNDHWIDNWQKNGWINSKKQPVENIELVQEIWRRISKPFYHCAIKKCDGHKGILGNELADALATQSMHIFDDLCKEYEVTIGEEE
jgi:ribonuclease HI